VLRVGRQPLADQQPPPALGGAERVAQQEPAGRKAPHQRRRTCRRWDLRGLGAAGGGSEVRAGRESMALRSPNVRDRTVVRATGSPGFGKRCSQL
jgi:hypothetical protein